MEYLQMAMDGQNLEHCHAVETACLQHLWAKAGIQEGPHSEKKNKCHKAAVPEENMVEIDYVPDDDE